MSLAKMRSCMLSANLNSDGLCFIDLKATQRLIVADSMRAITVNQRSTLVCIFLCKSREAALPATLRSWYLSWGWRQHCVYLATTWYKQAGECQGKLSVIGEL
ncbi:hypothetical protein BST61_g2479 [Cercospora zeina]